MKRCIISVLLLVLLISGCATTPPTSSPLPTPTPTPTILEYLREANDFEAAHTTTLSEVASAIETLVSESNVRANIGKASFRGLFSLDPNIGSGEEYLRGLAALSKLSPDEQSILDNDRAKLNDLLLRIKRDQIKLLQILPPTGTSTRYHEFALATIEIESTTLVNLLNFYSSPELLNKGEKFQEFPKRFAEAFAQIIKVQELWSQANVELLKLSRDYQH